MCQQQDSIVPSSCFDQFDVSSYVEMPSKRQCKNMNNNALRESPTSVDMDMSPRTFETVEVDICDDEILQLWKSYQ